MSGVKRTPVEILRDELRATRNQVYSIANQRKKLEKELSKVQQQQHTQISNLENQMEKRNKAYQSALSGLESDMQSMATEHHETMQKQRKDFIHTQRKQREKLLKEIDASENRTNSKIGKLHDWTSSQLKSQRAEYQSIAQQQQKQLEAIKSNIKELNSKEVNRQERASAYYNDLRIMIEAADENIPHEKFAPGKLDKIKRQLNAGGAHIKNDVPSAAIAVIQQAHFDLMDLEEEVQRKEVEFELTFGTTLDAITALLETVRSNRTIELEEDEFASTHEADFWTSGKFGGLEEEIESKKALLEEDKEKLSIAEVEQILNDLEGLSAQQEALLTEAVERIVSSQLRAEMGDMVVDSLYSQGFSMNEEECGYAENDQRKPYLIKVENKSGTKVVTVISPDEQTHENIISVNTYDGGFHDERAEQQRNDEILKALSDSGLQLGETECQAESIKDFYDVQSIIKSGSKGIPKKGLEKAGMLNSQTESKSS